MTALADVLEGRERWAVLEGDCLEIMRQLPDGCVDAVVTDPPYGISADEAASKNKGKWGWRFYGETQWDRERPPPETFKRICMLDVPTVVWGGNYFADLLPPSMGWLCWDKGQRDFSLADFELAWTSEQRAARCIVYPRARALADGRFHPTQKPVQVMAESLNYLRLPAGALVFDPFCGSGTTGVAALGLGYRFLGIEREAAYVDIARRRIADAAAQGNLFGVTP